MLGGGLPVAPHSNSTLFPGATRLRRGPLYLILTQSLSSNGDTPPAHTQMFSYYRCSLQRYICRTEYYILPNKKYPTSTLAIIRVAFRSTVTIGILQLFSGEDPSYAGVVSDIKYPPSKVEGLPKNSKIKPSNIKCSSS